MNKRILLHLLLILSLLLSGCTEDKPAIPEIPEVPEIPEIPEGTLPVVFHVMWDDNPEDEQQNPANSIFIKRIGQLNKFYSGDLFSYAKSEKIDVLFTLALYDPDSKEMAEPGVNRVHYAGSSNMSATDFLQNENLTTREKAILWDPNKYINIWLFGFDTVTEPNVTGISYLSYATTANPLAMLTNGDRAITGFPGYMHGLALNNRYFLPPVSGIDSNDEGLFTLCHEIGHYLGLLHAFVEPDANGNSVGCGDKRDNSSDDACSDTPKYDRATYEAWLVANIEGLTFEAATLRTPCDEGIPFVATNIMDYFYGYRTNITAQQRDRIEHVVAYSPWIPRSTKATKALLDNSTREITDEPLEPILMY